MESMKLRHLTRKTKSTEVLSEMDSYINSKRSADTSPDAGNKKRSVLSDLTNTKKAIANLKLKPGLRKHTKIIPSSTSSISSSIIEEDTSAKKKNDYCNITKDSTDEILFTTAYDGFCSQCDISPDAEESVFEEKADCLYVPPIPSEVTDFDNGDAKDTFSESVYAPYIFAYYREREKLFTIEKYLASQPEITKGMRAVLVDWMVEVQESFELNHETLYLAVKLVDIYLMKHQIAKARLQLVGATAVFIAAKYDERIPPVVDDFLYICDDSYSRGEFIAMEASILRTVGFDLGIPVSYRFLRRYARCTKASMETLTLARYILESALMDYELIDTTDSKISAAAMLLALKMKKLGPWTPTHEYYSGYKEKELDDLMKALNKNIASRPNKNLLTVRTKYSHAIFFEVAKIPALVFEDAAIKNS